LSVNKIGCSGEQVHDSRWIKNRHPRHKIAIFPDRRERVASAKSILTMNHRKWVIDRWRERRKLIGFRCSDPPPGNQHNRKVVSTFCRATFREPQIVVRWPQAVVVLSLVVFLKTPQLLQVVQKSIDMNQLN
jgi:hypothetical protein